MISCLDSHRQNSASPAPRHSRCSREFTRGLRIVLLAALPALSVAVLPGAGASQEHRMTGHGEHGEAGGWRMPPMSVTMPMVPGLENAIPPVRPFLIGDGMDPAMFPPAEPSRRVVMENGDTLDMDVSLVRRTIGGRDYVMLGYEGQYPGPLIQADRGSRIMVRVTNRIRMPTTVHWHGIRLENRFDGVAGLTQDPIAEGETFTYEVDVPDAGMFWYHPHMREDVQQDLGLYGNLLVRPLTSDYYGPSHRKELLMLDDILIDEQGLIPWGEEAPTHALMGRFGTVMLTNGVDDHRIEARTGEVVRFYLTNVANTRTFNVRFGTARVKLVASDIGKFERETWVESVVVAPAERYVVDVRFGEGGEVGITNTIQAVNHFRGTFYPQEDTLAVVSVTGPPVADEVTAAFGELRENRDVAEEHRALPRPAGEARGLRAGDDGSGAGSSGAHRGVDGSRHLLRAAGGVERRHADDELAVDGHPGHLDPAGTGERTGKR